MLRFLSIWSVLSLVVFYVLVRFDHVERDSHPAAPPVNRMRATQSATKLDCRDNDEGAAAVALAAGIELPSCASGNALGLCGEPAAKEMCPVSCGLCEPQPPMHAQAELVALRRARHAAEDARYAMSAAQDSPVCAGPLALPHVEALTYVPREAGNSNCRDFGGQQSMTERAAALNVQRQMPALHCGFLADSGFDAAVRQVADHHRCPVVTFTSIFGQYDHLVQPRVVPGRLRHCFYAFVDVSTRTQLLAEAARPVPSNAPLGASTQAGASGAHRIGHWRLVTVGEERCKPYGRPRRNSRVPKLLGHRFFPRANFTLWINPDLALMMSPEELVSRFLVTPGAVFAALRHFKRANVRAQVCPAAIRLLQRRLPHTGARREARTSERLREEFVIFWSAGTLEQRPCIEEGLVCLQPKPRPPRCVLSTHARAPPGLLRSSSSSGATTIASSAARRTGRTRRC